jgi:succinyl-CoA synthetase beta subunit
MKLHEYQAKRLFAQFGIPVPRGVVAASPRQAKAAYGTLKKLCRASGRFVCNVKAQIHAGGRGKAGGVLVASSAKEASQQAAQLLGRRLVTHQTGPEGLPVRRVLLDERVAVTQELYVAITIDRFAARPIVLASQRGGVDIETVAREDPQAITREAIDPLVGLLPFQTRRLHGALGLSKKMITFCDNLLAALYRCVESCDASLVEINPLVETPDGHLLALDAKVALDDNGLVRHPALAKLRDPSQEHPLEVQAGRVGISYVGLEGTIGCLVNGAGLAMATNDIIKLHGGSPANFLDVGGGANIEQVTSAFRILLSDKRVGAILVNIFGGIMRCDWIAQGLLNATKGIAVTIPIVVRLAGTNVEEGKRLLATATFSMTTADDLAEAAKEVVELARA